MTSRIRRSEAFAGTFSQIFATSPPSRELPELAASRRFVSRVRQQGIGPLVRAPLSRIIAPAWQMLVWHAGQYWRVLVSEPLRRTAGTDLAGCGKTQCS